MKLTTNGVITQSKPKFEPSPYQEDIFDWATNGEGNVVVQAVAGSGKSETGVQLFKRLNPDESNIFVAFNKHIQVELQSRLPREAQTKTYHSLGFANIRKNVGNVRMDEYKIDNILKNKVGPSGKFMLNSIKRMIGLCKSGAIENIYEQNLSLIAMDHDIELFDERSSDARDTIFDCVQYGYNKSAEVTDVIDFDDMPWLPVYHKMPLIQYDFIFGDEVQDTSRVQSLLLVGSVQNGRMCGCGDKFQSIYRFRGADDTAMDHLKQDLNAGELPLSISYRAPKVIVDLINREFPEIRFEGREVMPEGKIENINQEQVLSLAQPKDLILCRVNADLIPMAFQFIRSGIKAQVAGRDIGKGLQSLVKKLSGNTIEDMLRFLYEYRDRELAKAYQADRQERIQFITDKVDTIVAISENCKTISDVLATCDQLFSDDIDGITLSSIHKAKGKEADRVFILRPDLLPHPAAKSAGDKQAERNISYVAKTRTRNELYFVR